MELLGLFFFRYSSRPVSYCPFTSLVWYLGTAGLSRRQLDGLEKVES